MRRIKVKGKERSQYFASDNPNISFFSSGCEILNCILGGGWVIGGIVNIVGDKSSGKTLLAIEAMANFQRQYPRSKIIYDDAEQAFDPDYAEDLGLKLNSIDFKGSDTVEEWFESMEDLCKGKGNKPSLYVIDSLDALSDAAELERDIDKGTYGTKAKQLSEIFRRLKGKLRRKNVTIFIVSQVRDNIGVTFGEKKKRSGGKALDFYALQVLWLSEISKIPKTIKKVKRVIGINIRANCKKNKIDRPWRLCDFPILFNYGIDDVKANRDWLEADAHMSTKLKGDELNKLVRDKWRELETSFMPKKRKYR